MKIFKRTAPFWVITLWVVVICYQCFGTTHLTMELRDCPKTSVRNYHCSLHNNLEECCSHLICGESLKSMQDFEESITGEPRWEKIYLLEHRKTRKIQKELLCWQRRLDVLVHIIKACDRSGGIAPQIFNLGCRWMWAVSLMPWLPYGHEKELTVPIEYEARWAPVLVWIIGRTENCLVPARNLTIVPCTAPSCTGHTNTCYRDLMLLVQKYWH